jgi:hypothetical protein
MAKITDEHLSDHNLNADEDVLGDIAPEDYVFVVKPNGTLKGISLPEIDVDTSPEVEEIFNFFIQQAGGKNYLASTTIH